MTAHYFGMALNCLSSSEFRPCGVCSSCRKFLAFEHPDFIYIFPTPNYKMSPTGEIKDNSSLSEYAAYLENRKNSPYREFFFSASTEIRKESIMMLQHRLHLSAHEAQFRICIIEDADEMNANTANAFLKTLEEPPARTVIILLTKRMQILLPTIISRCQLVFFNPLPRNVIEGLLIENFNSDPVSARTASLIANGNMETAIRIAQESSSENRQLAIKILTLAAANKELEFHNLLNKGKEILNGEFLFEVLNYLSLFVSDLTLINRAPDSITNIDQSELLASIAAKNKDLDEQIHQTLLTIEDLKRKIDGHVNTTLILIKIYFTLRELVKP